MVKIKKNQQQITYSVIRQDSLTTRVQNYSMCNLYLIIINMNICVLIYYIFT